MTLSIPHTGTQYTTPVLSATEQNFRRTIPQCDDLWHRQAYCCQLTSNASDQGEGDGEGDRQGEEVKKDREKWGRDLVRVCAHGDSKGTGKAEVSQFERAGSVNQDVLWLEIPVQ